MRLAQPADIPAISSFLEQYVETSVFLLSNLRDRGIRSSASPLSGDFVLLEEDGALVGVFCLTVRGDLLAQTGGRADLAGAIVAGCERGRHRLTGVLAEWTVASAVWAAACARSGFAPTYESKSVVYRLDRPLEPPRVAGQFTCRALTLADYDVWEPVDRAFHEAEGLAVAADEERRRAGYRSRAIVGGWWGAFDGDVLVSTACLNAEYGGLAQVGGVYTRPEFRRRGLARLVMHDLTHHHARTCGAQSVVLFAAEQNVPARRMYASMGFAELGRFGLLFGVFVDAADGPAEVRRRVDGQRGG